MQTAGTSRGDGVVAVVVALVVHALIAWQLRALLAPPPEAGVDDATAALQVVWIAAVPRRAVAVVAAVQQPGPQARTSPVVARPSQLQAQPDLAATEAATDPAPVRSMTAVYLQQAGQWAQDHPIAAAPVDPLARRRIALAEQPASRFRLKRAVSMADAVAMVGVAFGNPPHPCVRNPDDVAGYATGGDAVALQMALDVDRQCRP